MSIESLLLLALFILLPLIERLLRSARQRKERTAEQVPDTRRPASRPPILPSTPQREPRTEAQVSHVTAVPLASAGPAARQSPRLQLTAPAARRARRGSVIDNLHDPLTLRRAVVLTAVLGPCRGVAPLE